MIRFVRFALYLILCYFHTTAIADIRSVIEEYCAECAEQLEDSTGVYILEYGEESLLSRAWLTEQAVTSIDVQYFIWSTDNIGILAAESLLSAAERGVTVRVLVDDLLVDADSTTLIALDNHPNVHIKIYNPKHKVGVSKLKRAWNAVSNFRDSNQRMHDKTAIFDNIAGVTGGRNMADEYFDFNHEYNFRDRDVLLLGNAVQQMTDNFEEFWNSGLSVAVQDLLDDKKIQISQTIIDQHYRELHNYAADESNYESAFRENLKNVKSNFPKLIPALIWEQVEFISDVPGKNTAAEDGQDPMRGGGEITTKLYELLKTAQTQVRIQSPYLVVPEEGIELMQRLTSRGVTIEISTNSMLSTDNLLAFSGYLKQRKKLLDAGVKIYEFKDNPAIQTELMRRYDNIKDYNPVFAIHAKSMVIDQQTVYIGTFNLDPRSANLNTEVGVVVNNPVLGQQLHNAIGDDIQEENSWFISEDFDPDGEASFGKRLKVRLLSWLPIDDVL